jgi:hypothetical protein
LKNRARTDAKIKVQDVVPLDELLRFLMAYLEFCPGLCRPPIPPKPAWQVDIKLIQIERADFFEPLGQGGVPIASVQETTIRESTVKTVGENVGLHPHIRWTKTPDFAHVYRGISLVNRVFFPTSVVCLLRLTQARRVFQRGQ